MLPSSGQRSSGRGSITLKIAWCIAPSAAAAASPLATRFPVMRNSVRPLPAMSATRKDVSTSIHRTTSKAKPWSCLPPAGARSCADIGLQPVWIWPTAGRFALKVLRHHPSIEQLVAQVVGERAGAALILNDMRRDQNEELGARARVVLGRQQRADDRDILQEGNSSVSLLSGVANEAGDADRLPILDGKAGADDAIVECRRTRRGVCRGGRDIADFLSEIERYQSIGIDPRGHLHDHPGRMVVDAVNDWRAGRQRAGRGPGQDWNLLANLEMGRLIVHDQKAGRR